VTRGGRRRGARLTCLSCRGVLDTVRSFCDDACQRYADRHGFKNYSKAKRSRGIELHPDRIRKDYR
jgi:hypothetical protein